MIFGVFSLIAQIVFSQEININYNNYNDFK